MIQQLVARAAIKRSIAFRELVLIKPQYLRCARIGQILNHAAVETQEGVICWDPNDLMRFLFPDETRIEHLMQAAHQGTFPPHELMKFAMQLGYSLDAFITMFASREAAWFPQIKDAKDDELLFDYVIRTCSKFDLYI